MEDVKLYVERVGVDPASGADIRIARRESTSWHKDIVAELINQVLRCGATLIIIAVLTACDDRQVSYFPDYAAIPEQSGIWTWLPVFFPSSASEIEMTFNLDSNLFYADFSVADGDKRAHFESVLGEESVVHYANFPHKSWCKTGKTLWNSEARAKPFFITQISVDRYRITNHMPGCTKPDE